MLIMCVNMSSKWVEAFVLETRASSAVWDAFFCEVICRYGVPRVVQVDLGMEYIGDFEERCRAWGI